MNRIALTLALFLSACSTAPPVSEISQPLTLPISATGHYDATLTFFQLENELVDAMLPPELERGPKTIPGSSHKHPVAILHQHYIDIAQPGVPGTRPGWNELTLYVVDLKLKDGNACSAHFGKSGPFAYLPVMHVDSPTALFIGNLFFGLNQHLATIDRSSANPGYYNVTSLDPTEPLTQVATFFENPLDAVGAANITPFLAALSAPTLGRKPDGTLVEHQVDWKFGEAAITSITGAVEVASTRLNFNRQFNGINEDEHGAFRVVAPFDSSVPNACAPSP